MFYKIEIFLSSLDVILILSKFLSLKQIKNGYIALCPFHSEKNPSFFFDAIKKRYYCFSCNRRGNILNFIMDYKNLSFKEVLEFLLTFSSDFKKKRRLLPKYLELLNTISQIYFRNLKRNFFLDKNLSFFLSKRGINLDNINTFKIGFAEGLDNLSKILFNFGYQENLLIDSGVFFLKNGSFLDRFQNRIVFPIRNVNGQIIAFGGRSLIDNFKPKYINSAETRFYSKSLEFYGLYEALNFFKTSTVIIVEGYIDVITLHSYGIKNVISILGTSFTKDHFKKLKSIYRNIIFCFDGDKAGRSASIKTAFSCLSYIQYGNFIGFILLPRNYDPDSFFKDGKKNKFLGFLKKPIYLLDLIFNRLKFNFKFKSNENENENENEDKNLKFLSYIFKFLCSISNIYIKKIVFYYFFKNYFNNECILFNHFSSLLFKFEKNAVSCAIRAAFLMLKNRDLFFKIEQNRFLFSKNINFLSDINFFFEVFILIKRYRLIDLNNINIFLFQKIKLEKFSYFNLKEDDFFSLLHEIYEKC